MKVGFGWCCASIIIVIYRPILRKNKLSSSPLPFTHIGLDSSASAASLLEQPVHGLHGKKVRIKKFKNSELKNIWLVCHLNATEAGNKVKKEFLF